MSHRQRSRFVWSGGDFTTDLPAKAWGPINVSIGGVRTSAARVKAGYRVRRDQLLALTPRVRETEWSAFEAFVEDVQFGEVFTWYPDADIPGVSFEVLLESPGMGERMEPPRSGDFARVFEPTLTLLGATDAPWLPYFDG
jgi:hypothetical protein